MTSTSHLLKLFHIGEKSGIHTAVTKKKKLWTKHDTQHQSQAFRKDAFPSNVSLSSLTFKASHCVTWHQNMKRSWFPMNSSNGVRFTTSGLWIHEFARTAPQTKQTSQIRSRLRSNHEYIKPLIKAIIV